MTFRIVSFAIAGVVLSASVVSYLKRNPLRESDERAVRARFHIPDDVEVDDFSSETSDSLFGRDAIGAEATFTFTTEQLSAYLVQLDVPGMWAVGEHTDASTRWQTLPVPDDSVMKARAWRQPSYVRAIAGAQHGRWWCVRTQWSTRTSSATAPTLTTTSYVQRACFEPDVRDGNRVENSVQKRPRFAAVLDVETRRLYIALEN